jgi:hypothetical protein
MGRLLRIAATTYAAFMVAEEVASLTPSLGARSMS